MVLIVRFMSLLALALYAFPFSITRLSSLSFAILLMISVVMVVPPFFDTTNLAFIFSVAPPTLVRIYATFGCKTSQPALKSQKLPDRNDFHH